MAKDSDTSVNSKSLSLDDSSSNKSFVKKVKSRVSGFLPSLTWWFGSTESQIRYRDESDEDEDESFPIHPPAKRIKQFNNSALNFQSNTSSTPRCSEDISLDVSPRRSVNHVEGKLTFPEPIPGPSGYKPKKNNKALGKSSLNKQLYTIHNDVMNGDKYSDSGESVTSGYSSTLVGGKDVVTENKAETTIDSSNEEPIFTFSRNSRSRNDRSLFEDRRDSPQQANTSLSTRQPSFNSSVFGSPSFVDRTLASKKILNSPFYGGRTAYGGASAYGRSLASFADNRLALRNTVQIKPVNETTKQAKLGTNTTLSKTARRILDTLEQYTTPITDAKKIPNPTNPNRKKHMVVNPYTVKERTAPNKGLQIPTVPDLLKMKLKERLQDSTVSVRQLANSSKSVLNREEYKIRTLEADEDNNTKHTNKMKSKISSLRQKSEPHRTVEEVKLPDIQLPITTLPKFDFSLPPFEPIKGSTASISNKTTEIVKSTRSVEKIVTNTQKTVESSKTEVKTIETCKKDNNKKTDTISKTESKKLEYFKSTEFKFSDPVVIAENLKSIRAINNFIFSEPTPTNKAANFPQKSAQQIEKTDNKNTDSATKNNGECNARKDVEGSVNPLDAYKRDSDDLMTKFKPSRDTWECSVCLIRNLNDKNKCIACEARRPQDTAKKEPAKPPSLGFGDKFKKSEGQWSCRTCLVVNPADKNKCVACESPKEDKISQNKSDTRSAGLLGQDMWECTTCLVRNKNSDVKCVACTNPRVVANGPLKPELKGFGNKFAPPPDTWLCDTCSIRNRNDILNCVACQTSRPANVKAPSVGFGEGFKKKDDQWECDTCMVRNSSDTTKCQCCDALKPGTTANSEVPKKKSNLSLFNFGIDPSAKLTTSGFSFGIKPADNKKNVIPTTDSFTPMFGQNVTATTNSVTTTSAAGTPIFTFGIKSTPETSEVVKPTNTTDSSSSTKNNEKPIDTLPIVTPTITSDTIDSKTEQKINENSTLNGETKPPVLFGASPASNTELGKPPSNIFGKEPNPASGLFTFNATATPVATTTSSTPVFGANTTQNTSAAFKFSSETNTKDKSALLIAFGNPTPQATPPPTNTKDKAPLLIGFGNPISQATPPPTFGVPTTNNLFTNTNAITFGASPAGDVKAATTGFGSRDDRDEPQPPAKMAMFSFGQTGGKQAEMEQPKFGFGGAQSSPSPGIFNFGQPTAQPNLNFSAGSNAGAAASQNGAGIFKFGPGSTAGAAKPGFNFGTPSGAPPAEKQSGPSADQKLGLFNFGFAGSAPAPSPNTGFNFSGSTNTDFKPNINSISGTQTPTFSAQPNLDDKPNRITRKAVRRVHR